MGYTLNTEQSTCEVNDKDAGGEIVYENGNLSFMNMNYKGTKCSVYFDLIPDNENPVINSVNTTSLNDTSVTLTIEATDNIGIFYYYYYKLDNEEEIRIEENSYTFEELEKDSVHTITVRVEDAAGNEISISKEVTVGLNAGRYILASSNAPTGEQIDWTGKTSYYYTGNPNNWVQFVGFWWRIIRINGDGSIRMIYQGTSANTTGTQIGTSVFNSSEENKTYVGLVYDGSTQHGYGTNSTIMNTLNTWYDNNLARYEEQYIDTGTGFCSDRNMASGDSYTDSSFDYAPSDRRNGQASLQCNSEDILSQDNEKLPNPIGLITFDEYVLAGNGNSYLDVGIAYWTMSPLYYEDYADGYASVLFVDQSGNRNNDLVAGVLGVRPVINLRSDVALSGSGTSTDPFKVVGA